MYASKTYIYIIYIYICMYSIPVRMTLHGVGQGFIQTISPTTTELQPYTWFESTAVPPSWFFIAGRLSSASWNKVDLPQHNVIVTITLHSQLDKQQNRQATPIPLPPPRNPGNISTAQEEEGPLTIYIYIYIYIHRYDAYVHTYIHMIIRNAWLPK